MTSDKFAIKRDRPQLTEKKFVDGASYPIEIICRDPEYTADEPDSAHLTLERALPRIFSFACRAYDAALSLL